MQAVAVTRSRAATRTTRCPEKTAWCGEEEGIRERLTSMVSFKGREAGRRGIDDEHNAKSAGVRTVC
jgi:hypothetical protein